MRRRSFLGLAAGGAFAGGLPTVLRSGFASDKAPALSVRDARREAQELGKPLLVIVVPKDEVERMERGLIWGEILSNASESMLCDLALTSVICAPASEVAGESGRAIEAETLAYLFETAEATPMQRAISSRGIDLGRPAHVFGGEDGEAFEKKVLARVEEVGERLRGAIAPDRSTLDRRFEQWNVLHQGKGWHLQEVLGVGGRPKLRHVDLAAPLVRKHKEGDATWMRRLADAAALRLFEDDPMGATWRTSSSYCPPCGMGHTPDVSRHFLELYAEDEER